MLGESFSDPAVIRCIRFNGVAKGMVLLNTVLHEKRLYYVESYTRSHGFYIGSSLPTAWFQFPYLQSLNSLTHSPMYTQ